MDDDLTAPTMMAGSGSNVSSADGGSTVSSTLLNCSMYLN